MARGPSTPLVAVPDSRARECAGSFAGPLHGHHHARHRGDLANIGFPGGSTDSDAGGSAVDAAIAANAVLSVVEPMMNGPGGDFFALVWDAKTESLAGINASGWPSSLEHRLFEETGIDTHAH